jgi:hypothetical protein
LSALLSNCKQDNQVDDFKGDNKKEVPIEINSSNSFINKEYLEIVKQGNQFKTSNSSVQNHIKLTDALLSIEIIEPIEYQIKKIETISENEIKIFIKNQNFYYKVNLIDKNKGISFWQNYDSANNKIDNDLSFYAIEKTKSLKTELPKANTEYSSEESKWFGNYYLELDAVNGDGNNIKNKFSIEIKDLKNIVLKTNKQKFQISADLYDEKSIQGDIINDDKNPLSKISPFLTLSFEDGVYYVVCPIIAKGQGFSDEKHEIEKN